MGGEGYKYERGVRGCGGCVRGCGGCRRGGDFPCRGYM